MVIFVKIRKGQKLRPVPASSNEAPRFDAWVDPWIDGIYDSKAITDKNREQYKQ
jgi:hypothetical protein